MISIKQEHLGYLQEAKIDISKALSDNDLDLVLEIIDDAIVGDIIDHNDAITKHGIYLQRIYDQINADNEV